MQVPLATGSLDLVVERAVWPLEALCGFAARRNPRRAFLVVSKVLGRHVPARPSVMRASMRDLAARVPDDLPGPVLVVGLAETAVCLGQGIHEELARRPGWDGLYIHSTRQRIGQPLLCRFEEPHSHASAHLIYRPRNFDLSKVRSLVLVDDEVSTGTTLVNLASALIGELPGVEHIVAAALTDWSGQSDWLARMPRPARHVSLLEGTLRWRAGGSPAQDLAGFDRAAPRLGTLAGHRDFGRLGWRGAPIPLPEVAVPEGARIRIVGTGEFTYPPFLLAERLERAGHDVVVQATSRSPALPGGAIGQVLSFDDNYDTGLANFLYNAAPDDGRLSLICHETPPGSIDPALVNGLKAICIGF